MNKGNSPKKWELLLTEISNMECAIIQSKSIKAKLFPGKSELSEEVEQFKIFNNKKNELIKIKN